MKSTTKTIAVINETKILVVQNGEKLVPIKPICQALGVDFATQKEKIENDEILSSTVGLSPTVAADGKEREMFCIPFKFVFGWIFTINPANVKEEVREGLVRYKLACYNALYQSFTDSQEFLAEKQELVEKKLEELDEITNNFKNAKSKLYDKKKELTKVREFTMEDWIANNRQPGLFK
ncbi:MAG: phage antirepressor N-terminal domain-containing protein [Cyclobacteriaceae bacterium]